MEEKYNEKVDVYSFGVNIGGSEMPKINLDPVRTGKKADIPSNFMQLHLRNHSSTNAGILILKLLQTSNKSSINLNPTIMK